MNSTKNYTAYKTALHRDNFSAVRIANSMAKATESTRLGVNKGYCAKSTGSVTQRKTKPVFPVLKGGDYLKRNLTSPMKSAYGNAAASRGLNYPFHVSGRLYPLACHRNNYVTAHKSGNSLCLGHRRILLLYPDAENTASGNKADGLVSLLLLSKKQIKKARAYLHVVGQYLNRLGCCLCTCRHTKGRKQAIYSKNEANQPHIFCFHNHFSSQNLSCYLLICSLIAQNISYKKRKNHKNENNCLLKNKNLPKNREILKS